MSDQDGLSAGLIALGQILWVIDLYSSPSAMRAALVETASLNERDAVIAVLHHGLANDLDAALTIAVANGLAVQN